jgi:hypothetical protein
MEKEDIIRDDFEENLLRIKRNPKLRKLLELYYYTHIEKNYEHRYSILGQRAPQKYPGTKTVKRKMNCGDTSASDFLAFINIIEDFFVKPYRGDRIDPEKLVGQEKKMVYKNEEELREILELNEEYE